MDFMAALIPFTTPSIDLETFLVVTADWTLLAVASILADILRKLRDWFFCLMAFSAWILATSIFPFSIAFFSLAFSAFSSLSHFLEFLSSSLAANFRLKRCFSILAMDMMRSSYLCCVGC